MFTNKLFKARYGVRFLQMMGEKLSTNESASVYLFKTKLDKKISVLGLIPKMFTFKDFLVHIATKACFFSLL